MPVDVDVLVVGGGPAGLAAALSAGESGARVILVDDQPRPLHRHRRALTSVVDRAGLVVDDRGEPCGAVDQPPDHTPGLDKRQLFVVEVEREAAGAVAVELVGERATVRVRQRAQI